MVEPHGFGIDGNRVAVAADIGQIAAMQAIVMIYLRNPRRCIPDRSVSCCKYSAFENKKAFPAYLKGVAHRRPPQSGRLKY
jgi:hypothetical protein